MNQPISSTATGFALSCRLKKASPDGYFRRDTVLALQCSQFQTLSAVSRMAAMLPSRYNSLLTVPPA